MEMAGKAAEENTLNWLSNVSKGLGSELKTLKSLSIQIAQGEIVFFQKIIKIDRPQSKPICRYTHPI